MAKDYKNSKRRAGSSGLSGMAGFVCGLALGLAVALGVYLFDRRTEARLTAQQTAAPMIRDEAKAQTSPPASQEEAETQEFDFYEMLPEVRKSSSPSKMRAEAPRRRSSRGRWRSRALISCRRARSVTSKTRIACGR